MNDELKDALRPFVEFHADGDAWTDTVWEDKPLVEAVMYDHKSGRKITLLDFYRAAEALRNAENALYKERSCS